MVTIQRAKEVWARRGTGRSTHYDDINKGLFVPPIAISARSRGYPSYEVDALIAAAIAGQSEAEIRDLVKRLVAARKNGRPT